MRAYTRRQAPRGEKHYAAKLTEAKVLQARELFASGHSKASIARMFGISESVMGRAINGGTWRHIKGAK